MEDNDDYDYFYNALIRGYLLGKADNQNNIGPAPVHPIPPPLPVPSKKYDDKIRELFVSAGNHRDVFTIRELTERFLNGSISNLILVNVDGKKEKKLGLHGYYIFLINRIACEINNSDIYKDNPTEFFNEFEVVPAVYGVYKRNPRDHSVNRYDEILYLHTAGFKSKIPINTMISLNLSFNKSFKAYNVPDELYNLGKTYKSYAVFSRGTNSNKFAREMYSKYIKNSLCPDVVNLIVSRNIKIERFYIQLEKGPFTI